MHQSQLGVSLKVQTACQTQGRRNKHVNRIGLNMISNNFEDYEVLSILGTTTYKVQNVSNRKIYVWKALTFEDSSQLDCILKQIKRQKEQTEQHLVKVYDCICKEDTGVIYVILEYLAHENLNSIMQRCLGDNKYLHENFLWKILHQIALTLKADTVKYLDLNNIFIDVDFNIKVFKQETNEKTDIGLIMRRLSTIQSGSDIVKLPGCYSNEFKQIIRFASSKTYTTKEIIDAVLCHPTIQSKLSQVSQIYIQNPETKAVCENKFNHETEDIYQAALRNLRKRERALTLREDKISLKEHELKKREKKVALLECSIREKLLHAEVYLKRCKETKSTGSTNAKRYDDLNSTLSAAAESFIATTSKKLNPDNIKKPNHFTRSLSQRRVQFKGHSPLKEKFSRNSKCPSEGYDGSRVKQKFETSSASNLIGGQNVQFEKDTQEYRPISWCEEAKQHAFELLRSMNEKENIAVKHTYL